MNGDPVKKAMALASLVKWHRWIGFAIALIVVLLSITGVALNHTSGLDLGGRAMPGWASALFYGHEVEELPLFTAANHEFTQCGAGQLRVNGKKIMRCGQLSGVLQTDEYLVAVCDPQLAIFSTDAEFIEPFYPTGSLTSVASLGDIPAAILLRASDQQATVLDLVTMESQPVTEASGLPETSQLVVVGETGGISNTLTWERLLQDLHAGRAVGGWGVWLVDLTALGLLWLTASGYLSWRARQKLLDMD